MRLVVLCALAGAAVVSASAQDAAATLPSNYKVQFENAWVKITSVRYEPLQKLPGHTHTPHPSAYVYLNDGPPVQYRHIGGHNIVATRPATKAGAFRVYRGLDEIHEVENTGNVASEFLRVEIKTTALSPDEFRGKFERPAAPAPHPIVHFDHPQLRITRLWVLPEHAAELSIAAEPAVVIALERGSGFEIGQAKWLPAGRTVRLSNEGAKPIDFLRFDFKTRPAVETAKAE